VTDLSASLPALPPRRGALWWFSRAVLVLILAALLYVAFRKVPLIEIGRVLSGLHLWQVAALLCVNALIYSLVTARWWIVVRAEARSIRYLPMIAVRMSVFAVSYFTLGPQVGGEPLQILYLRRKYGLSYTRATASVVMDKLFELLGNFVLLSFGLIALLHSGLLADLSGTARWLLLGLVLLVTWPLIHISLLYRRIYPVSAVLRLFGSRVTHHKAVRFIRASELLAGQFCQRHPRAMLAGLGVSLLAAVATVSEYALITSFLSISLPFWKLITAWTTGWLAFLVPLPGGLGALEASQVSVLGLFGISAAAAMSVALLMRGRDLLIGGLGLVFAGRSARRLTRV
jgi:uncharacterized protein (TIRG00374 family)